MGSLVHYLCHAESANFQLANITFVLLSQLDEAVRRRVRDKKIWHKIVCETVLEKLAAWLEQSGAARIEVAGGFYEPSIRH